ncbi:MAG: hypothetical protein WBE66_16095 [Mycobacterium sp.]
MVDAKRAEVSLTDALDPAGSLPFLRDFLGDVERVAFGVRLAVVDDASAVTHAAP